MKPRTQPARPDHEPFALTALDANTVARAIRIFGSDPVAKTLEVDRVVLPGIMVGNTRMDIRARLKTTLPRLRIKLAEYDAEQARAAERQAAIEWSDGEGPRPPRKAIR